jgi:hypothetical protein
MKLIGTFLLSMLSLSCLSAVQGRKAKPIAERKDELLRAQQEQQRKEMYGQKEQLYNRVMQTLALPKKPLKGYRLQDLKKMLSNLTETLGTIQHAPHDLFSIDQYQSLLPALGVLYEYVVEAEIFLTKAKLESGFELFLERNWKWLGIAAASALVTGSVLTSIGSDLHDELAFLGGIAISLLGVFPGMFAGMGWSSERELPETLLDVIQAIASALEAIDKEIASRLSGSIP